MMKSNLGMMPFCFPAVAAASGTGVGGLAVVIALSGAFTAWMYVQVGVACAAAEASGALRTDGQLGDFRLVWSHHVGERSSFVVDAAFTVYVLFVCAAYVPMVHAYGIPILEKLGLPAQPTGLLWKLFIVATFLWLGTLRYLDQMTWLASSGLLASVSATLVVLLRCFDGTYAPGGAFLHQARARPLSPPPFWAMGPGALLVASQVNYAWASHFLAPKFYAQLNDRSVPRFRTVVLTVFAGLAVIYWGTGAAGLATFGMASQTPILSSYAENDWLANLSSGLMAVSIMAIYPYIFVCIWEPIGRLHAKLTRGWSRGGGGGTASGQRRLRRVVLLFHILLLAVGALVSDLGAFVTLCCSIVSSMAAFVLPAVLSLRLRQGRLKSALCYVSIFLGLSQMACGVASSVSMMWAAAA